LKLEGYELSDSVRKNFLKMFTEGIEIDTKNIFCHSRVA
jgi:hypothetical protein